jgi:hypothetical protein
MEAICSSEKSVDFQRTTRHYIPGDRTPSVLICTYLAIVVFTVVGTQLSMAISEGKVYENIQRLVNRCS